MALAPDCGPSHQGHLGSESVNVSFLYLPVSLTLAFSLSQMISKVKDVKARGQREWKRSNSVQQASTKCP